MLLGSRLLTVLGRLGVNYIYLPGQVKLVTSIIRRSSCIRHWVGAASKTVVSSLSMHEISARLTRLKPPASRSPPLLWLWASCASHLPPQRSRDESFVEGITRTTSRTSVLTWFSTLSGEWLHATWMCVTEFGKAAEQAGPAWVWRAGWIYSPSWCNAASVPLIWNWSAARSPWFAE